jgi:tetratricopeptide (TPR) repeat protein
MRSVLFALTLLWSGAALAADDAAQRAGVLNEQAMTAYDLGNYERSAELLKQAYGIYPDADLLYNLGRAYRSLKQYDKAIETYKAYLRRKPQSPYKNPVQRMIKEMEDLQKAQEQSNEKPPTTMVPTPAPQPAPATQPAQVPPPSPHPPEDLWYEDYLAWGLAGAGAIGLGLGAGMHLWANGREADLDTAPETDKQGIRDQVNSRRTIGTVSLAVGGALFIGGIVKFVLTGTSSPEPQRTAIVVGTGYVGVVATF